MSDPVPQADKWFLDDLTEQLDIQEDDSKITKIRQHFTIQIHQSVIASAVPVQLSIGQRKASISYSVGALTRTKNPPAVCKFICVSDGISPVEHPGEYCIRRQTWEVFGKFIDAPAEWNQ